MKRDAAREPIGKETPGDEIFTNIESISELFACYNRTMPGFFLAGSFGSYLAGRCAVLRQRIDEFLDELKISYRLLSDHSEFVERHAEISTGIVKKVYRASVPVFEYL